MDYVAPTSLKEALTLLRKPRSGARLVSGGTDVLPRVAGGKMTQPKVLVSINRLPGLDKITLEGKSVLRIGAQVTLAEVARSALVRRVSVALAEAASWVGSEQIRNSATLVGNLCSASSAADTIPPLLCGEAVVEIVGSKGRRRLAVEDLVVGPRKLALKADELVLGVRVPVSRRKVGSAYRRHGSRAAMDCAVVVASAEVVAKKDKIIEARLALGAVHPVPVRCPSAERLLAGQVPEEGVLAEAAVAAAESVSPMTDIRASAEHRAAIVRRMVPQVILKAFVRAGGKRV
jgi:carbon-monoxide dehydrogenase medium subunit